MEDKKVQFTIDEKTIQMTMSCQTLDNLNYLKDITQSKRSSIIRLAIEILRILIDASKDKKEILMVSKDGEETKLIMP